MISAHPVPQVNCFLQMLQMWTNLTFCHLIISQTIVCIYLVYSTLNDSCHSGIFFAYFRQKRQIFSLGMRLLQEIYSLAC